MVEARIRANKHQRRPGMAFSIALMHDSQAQCTGLPAISSALQIMLDGQSWVFCFLQADAQALADNDAPGMACLVAQLQLPQHD